MCGIAGIVSKDSSIISDDVLFRMAVAVAHRGPDGQASWISAGRNAGFAHRRLAIIDTTAAAAQPMHYLNRYTIVYNGEIYNYIELRETLKSMGYTFRTCSDTEVILAAYAHFGDKCVLQFDGMFAFAIYDEHEKVLFCARDRFGEKPFFYSHNSAFCFGSEIKALESAGIATDIDNGMLLQFLCTGLTSCAHDAARTFSVGIRKLPASHWLKYDVIKDELTVKKYWDVRTRTRKIPLTEALDELHGLIKTSVKRRLRSDVAIGCCLSGGLDSSTIAAIMSSLGIRNFKTFTSGFPGFEKDETNKAKSVAETLGFKSYVTEPSAYGLIEDFEKVIYHQEEPFSSASVYAQFKVFGLAASEKVTVLLDGQGADEVLAGYDHYRTWGMRSLFPTFTSKVLERKQRRQLLSDPTLNESFVEAAARTVAVSKPVTRQLNDLLYFDTFCGALEELLRYADRNSMAHGREVRLPFLNHELVDFAFSLPSSYKINRGYTKWVLRKLMDNRLAGETVWNKRKTGFEPPQKMWMETDVARAYLSEARRHLVKEQILRKEVIQQELRSHGAFDKQAAAWRWMVVSAFINKKRGLNRNSTPFLKSNIL